MKIKSVRLHDVKSYDDSSPSIFFQSGVNAIIGENGSGKSTLCEAIGFALFDYLHPYSQADFVKEGKKSGRVSVTFEANDNHVYRIDRGVNQSKYSVFNMTTKQKILLQGKNDVLFWLKDELGVPSSMDLQTIWKSSLGVPQGKFTNDFAETPSIRAQLFNPLLEVDVYRDLWKDMKHVIDVISTKKEAVTQQITRLESMVEELPILKKQVKTLSDQIKKTSVILQELKEKKKDAEQQKKTLETLQKEIESINHQLELHQEKQKDINRQIKQTKQHCKVAKQAKKIVSTHAESYKKYVDNTKKLEKLSNEKKKKESLEKKAVELEKKLSRYQDQLKHVEKEIIIASESKEKIKELKPLVRKQETLEEKILELNKKEEEINRVEKEKNQIKEKISMFRKKFRSLQKQINQINEKKELAYKRKQFQNHKDELLQERSVLVHLQKELTDSISLLKSKTTSKCPTCSRALDDAHRNKIISQKQTEIKSAQTKIKKVKKELTTIEQQLKKAIDAEQQVKRLSDLTTIQVTIQKDADEQKKNKEEKEKTLVSLKKEIAKKQKLQKQIKALDNPKQVFQQAQVRYEDHKDKKEKQKQLKENLVDITRQINQISKNLNEYASVQKKIDSLEKNQKTLKEPYELYLQNKEAASKIDFWNESLSILESSFEKIKEKITNYSKKLLIKQKEFDEKEYKKITSLLEKLKQKCVRQQTQIDEWKKQKEDKKKRVFEKEKQKKKLLLLKKNHVSLEKDIEFAEFLRETYQKTRPLVTEILVEEISREADRIYRELRGVPSEELAWKKDYEIIVYESGNNRAFHKLSGGEQMCAALSVRLAILKLLSTMDIVFLDEPTMNLDEEKKDNLVAQLRDLSGFSQIFVISHDETFESMTEHVITLEKRQGATRLLNHFQGGF